MLPGDIRIPLRDKNAPEVPSDACGEELVNDNHERAVTLPDNSLKADARSIQAVTACSSMPEHVIPNQTKPRPDQTNPFQCQ